MKKYSSIKESNRKLSDLDMLFLKERKNVGTILLIQNSQKQIEGFKGAIWLQTQFDDLNFLLVAT